LRFAVKVLIWGRLSAMMETEMGETDAQLGARSKRVGYVRAPDMGLIIAGRMPGMF
jgi:hypothetical protein